MPGPTYHPIANFTLSANTTSITFSGINQSYRDLIVILGDTQSSKTSDNSDAIAMRFNGDSSASYRFMYAVADGANVSSAQSGDASSFEVGHLPTLFASATKGNCIFNIMDYSTTDKHKTFISRSNQQSGMVVKMQSGKWASTSPVTSITLFSILGFNFVAGMSFSVYGVAA